MEKVKLTKEQAELLKNVVERYGKEALLKDHCVGPWLDKNYACLNNLSVEQMAKALYIGYEVEQTKEEKLQSFYHDFYKHVLRNEINEDYSKGIKKGIQKALDTLGIEIEGINK